MTQAIQQGEYPKDWAQQAHAVKKAANYHCIRCGVAHDADTRSGHTLTVHHWDGNKSNCEWWNLLALCQGCHLQIQHKVHPDQVWLLPHSEWFKPYVAGFYAHKAGMTLSREMVERFAYILIELGQQRIDIGTCYTAARNALWDEYNTVNGHKATIHDERHDVCPFCFSKTDAEFVDVGVGLHQCGPHFCDNCGATESGTGFEPGPDDPLLCGWYKRKPPTDKEIVQALRIEAASTVPFGSGLQSEHHYGCKCDVCLTWWIGMGPEDIDENGVLQFGPFSEQRIRARLGDSAEQKFAQWRKQFENMPEEDE